MWNCFFVLLRAMSSDASYCIRNHSYHSSQVHRNVDLFFFVLLPGMSSDAGICKLLHSYHSPSYYIIFQHCNPADLGLCTTSQDVSGFLHSPHCRPIGSTLECGSVVLLLHLCILMPALACVTYSSLFQRIPTTLQYRCRPVGAWSD
jgi:hypothetical protein